MPKLPMPVTPGCFIPFNLYIGPVPAVIKAFRDCIDATMLPASLPCTVYSVPGVDNVYAVGAESGGLITADVNAAFASLLGYTEVATFAVHPEIRLSLSSVPISTDEQRKQVLSARTLPRPSLHVVKPEPDVS